MIHVWPRMLTPADTNLIVGSISPTPWPVLEGRWGVGGDSANEEHAESKGLAGFDFYNEFNRV